MSGQLQITGRLTSRKIVLVFIELEQIWRNFCVRMPEISKNLNQIISPSMTMLKSKMRSLTRP